MPQHTHHLLTNNNVPLCHYYIMKLIQIIHHIEFHHPILSSMCVCVYKVTLLLVCEPLLPAG